MNSLKCFLFISIMLCLFLLESCSVGKVLDSKQYVIIEKYSGSLVCKGNSDKYFSDDLSDDYLNDFYDALVEKLDYYNIEVVNSPAHVFESTPSSGKFSFYTINISSISNAESYQEESVVIDTVYNTHDVYYITDCNVDMSFDVLASNSSIDEMDLKSASVSVGKEETLNNNRTFFQVLFGTNKDNSEINYKELDEDVYYSLYRKAARRVAGKTSRIIFKNL